MTTFQEPVDIDAEDGDRRFATISDDALENLRRLIGVPIADTVEPWCYEVGRSNQRGAPLASRRGARSAGAVWGRVDGAPGGGAAPASRAAGGPSSGGRRRRCPGGGPPAACPTPR